MYALWFNGTCCCCSAFTGFGTKDLFFLFRSPSNSGSEPDPADLGSGSRKLNPSDDPATTNSARKTTLSSSLLLSEERDLFPVTAIINSSEPYLELAGPKGLPRRRGMELTAFPTQGMPIPDLTTSKDDDFAEVGLCQAYGIPP